MRTKSRSRIITERTSDDWPRVPTHPGEILLEEFLKPMGITQLAFAKQLGISLQRLNGIVRCRRAVTAETAVLLGEAFDMHPEFWTNLQATFDLSNARQARERSGAKILPVEKAARRSRS